MVFSTVFPQIYAQKNITFAQLMYRLCSWRVWRYKRKC